MVNFIKRIGLEIVLSQIGKIDVIVVDEEVMLKGIVQQADRSHGIEVIVDTEDIIEGIHIGEGHLLVVQEVDQEADLVVILEVILEVDLGADQEVVQEAGQGPDPDPDQIQSQNLVQDQNQDPVRNPILKVSRRVKVKR